MDAQNGRIVPVRTAIAAVLMAAVAGGLAPAFGQDGAYSNVERRLGQQQESPQQPAGPEQADQPEATGPEDDMKKIVGAKTVEELIEIGKTLVLSQKRDLAAIAVEKIIARQPELLEDSQKQTPRLWNEFWFTHRAKLREKKLSPKDAAGRAKIALWLYEAGLPAPARAVLTTALAINKDDPAVKELAQKWNVQGGGPVQFDFTCGLKEPLIVDAIQDEGQVVSPRGKDRVFLILPVAFQAGAMPLVLSKGDVRVVGDDGRPYSVTGLALLERSDGTGGPASGDDPLANRGRIPELKMQAGSEPLWEQVLVRPVQQGQPTDGQPLENEVIVKNIMHPIVRPAPGQGRPSGRIDRSSNRPMQESKPNSGYAAYVVEIPQTLKTLECTYKKGELQISLDIEFVRALSKQVENLQTAERDQLISIMAGQATAKSAPVASAALRKLNAIRLQVGKGQATGGTAIKASPAVTKIEQVLLAALGHESSQVRRDAFNLLNRDISEEFAESVVAPADANVVRNLVAEVEAYFADLREARAAIEAANEATGSTSPPQQAPVETLTGLPLVPGQQNIGQLLVGCLKCKHAPVLEAALAAVLSNPFEQTVSALEFASEEAVGQLLARVPKVEDVKVKQAILSVLLKRASGRQLAEILNAFSDTPVVVNREEDPILTLAMREGQPAEVQRLILETLARADLSAVAGSDRIRKLIELLGSSETKRDAKVRAAMLKLATNQLKSGYEAPIKRSSRSGGRDRSQVSFETLLATVAVAPDTDSRTSRQAAATLLGLGLVRELSEKLKGAQGGEARVQDWIQNLGRDKNLAAREALPVFVANQLVSTDPKTLQLAVTALSAIQKMSDAKQRWKVNLAIKQGLEAKQLVTLTVHEQETVARPALALLRDLSGMTTAEAAEFEGLPDENARQGMLNSLEQNRSSKAVGSFACMVYVDVRTNPAAVARQPGRRAPVEEERQNVPLTSTVVAFQRGARDGQVRVIADGTPIGPPDTRQGGSSSASPGSIPINASALLRAALNSPEAQAEGLAGKVNPASLRAPIICELKYEQLGAWGAEVTVQDTGDPASSEFPLRVVGAKILLEPITQ